MVQFFVDQINVDATDFRRQLKYAVLQEQPLSKANYANFETKIIQFTGELERELQKLEIQLQLSHVTESFRSTHLSSHDKSLQDLQNNSTEVGKTTNVQRKRSVEEPNSTQSRDSQLRQTSLKWQNSSEDNEFIVLESKETDT